MRSCFWATVGSLAQIKSYLKISTDLDFLTLISSTVHQSLVCICSFSPPQPYHILDHLAPKGSQWAPNMSSYFHLFHLFPSISALPMLTSLFKIPTLSSHHTWNHTLTPNSSGGLEAPVINCWSSLHLSHSPPLLVCICWSPCQGGLCYLFKLVKKKSIYLLKHNSNGTSNFSAPNTGRGKISSLRATSASGTDCSNFLNHLQ